MNIAGFVTVISIFLGVGIAAAIFIVSYATRVRRLRSLFGRICLQLCPDQRVSPTSYETFKHLIREDADALTAADFLDARDKTQSLLDHVGDVSRSLFLPPVVTHIGLAHAFALIVSPIIIGTLCLVPPMPDIIGRIASDQGMAILLAIAAAAGVLFSLFSSIIVWRILFERDLSATLNLVEQQPLWSVGEVRRPSRRVMVLPKDDAEYAALKG